MNIFVLTLFAALVCAAACICYLDRRKLTPDEAFAGAKRGIEGCECLLALVANIQRHRGMTAAKQAGEVEFDEELVETRTKIASLLKQLESLANAETLMSKPCFTFNEFRLLRHRWGTLLENLPDTSIEKAISIHSQLIAILLNWLDVLGESRIELPFADRLSSGAIRNYVYRLPLLAECVGQVRATGSSVSAKGVCSSVERVRLMFLLARAETLIEQASSVDHRGAKAAALIHELADTTRIKILGATKVGISGKQYFDEATRVIDEIFNWIALCQLSISAQFDSEATVVAPEQHLISV